MEEKQSQPQDEVLSQQEVSETVSIGKNELEVIHQQLTAEKDKYVRLLAEFDNARKRQQREREELIKYAHEEVIVESLKLYDDLSRSLAAFKANGQIDANLLKGLEMVFNNFKGLMDKYAVKPIEALGKPFDHNCHEVLMQQETAEFPDGVVMEVFEQGYTLGGRVVRTAKVKVAKNNN